MPKASKTNTFLRFLVFETLPIEFHEFGSPDPSIALSFSFLALASLTRFILAVLVETQLASLHVVMIAAHSLRHNQTR